MSRFFQGNDPLLTGGGKGGRRKGKDGQPSGRPAAPRRDCARFGGWKIAGAAHLSGETKTAAAQVLGRPLLPLDCGLLLLYVYFF
jgi:hypothetical protein